MNFLNNMPVMARGTIYPSRFVAIDTASDFGVITAALPDITPVGISQSGTKVAPNLLQSLGSTAPTIQPAAVSGDSVGVFSIGDVCWLTVGSAAVTPGDFLKNDGNGGGIPAAAGEPYGARTFQAGDPDELVEVLVCFGVVPS